MIISASRRTDIPAFYAEWFMNRIRAGFCEVPNPFNPKQISRVPLDPQAVDLIVFWTRNPRPLLAHLSELDELGYRYCFFYTLLANPRQIDPGSPPVDVGIDTFRNLSDRIGPQKVVWRYDPVFLSSLTDFDFHRSTFLRLTRALKGYTERTVISVAHLYRKTQKRIRRLEELGITLLPLNGHDFASLMSSLAETAFRNGIQLQSCADELNLRQYGIPPGKCIDDELISKIFGFNVVTKKDTCQRKQCGCIESQDIGMYESCPSGCTYCYAVTSFERAKANHRVHDPRCSCLIGSAPLSKVG